MSFCLLVLGLRFGEQNRILLQWKTLKIPMAQFREVVCSSTWVTTLEGWGLGITEFHMQCATIFVVIWSKLGTLKLFRGSDISSFRTISFFGGRQGSQVWQRSQSLAGIHGGPLVRHGRWPLIGSPLESFNNTPVGIMITHGRENFRPTGISWDGIE
jgi:hypothetical protein